MKKILFEKRWKVMKIGIVQILIALSFYTFTAANTNYPQVLERKVTIHLDHVTFVEALQRIEESAKIKFVYSLGQFAGEEQVTLSRENIPLKKVLEDLLSPRNIIYKVHEPEGSITLRKEASEKKQSVSTKLKDPVSFLVTGTVTDGATDLPMAGVNIIIKGSTAGTTSDNNGSYIINVAENDILVFSFIGYSSKEIVVTNQSVINVSLEEDILSLKEVVINAGYYTTKKEQHTGNISKVASADIEKQSVSNPIATLQGRVAGLEITQTSGVPGGNFQVRIRGQNSITSGNDPLFIVDGVPFISSTLSLRETSGLIYADGLGSNPLNSINPQDIESIEVLKDADATAIYGSRGANGVILITTKKGKKGSTNVTMNYREGTGRVSHKMDLLNTPQYLAMRKEAFQNDGVTPSLSSAPDLLAWDQNRYTDWQSELIGGTARFRDAQINIAGGENRTQFSVGAGYHRETTVFPGNNSDQRLSGHASLNNISPNEKLKTSVSLNYSVNHTSLPNKDLTGLALTLAPNAPALHDESGNLNWGPDAWNGVGTNANPLSYTNCEFETQTYAILGNATISYEIIPGLSAKSNMGFSRTGMDAVTTVPLSAMDPGVAVFSKNSSMFSDNLFKNWIVEPQLNWIKKFKSGTIDVLAGTSFLEQITDGKSQQGVGFASESLMKNVNAADAITRSNSVFTQYRYHAAFGRINYSFRDKYIVNLTGRRDGSSRFGPGKQFASFGAIGGSWIFSKENFLNNSSVLSFGKLRGSFGITGNDQIGDYQYLDTYSPKGSGAYQGMIGLAPQRLYNPVFAWETVKKLEAAVELGFFNDRLTADIVFYRNRSSNQLVGTPLPPTTGFYSIQSNFPATVENRGLEILLNSVNIKSGPFSWTSIVNFTLPKNELIRFPGLETSPYANLYAVGEPLQISKLNHFTGVDLLTGMYTFEDHNADGRYTMEDRYIVRSRNRQFYGGISNSLSYKNFQLDFVLDFVKQRGMNYLTYFSSAPGEYALNVPTYALARWQNAGDQSPAQRYSTLSAYQTAYANVQISDQAITDASFIRLKTFSLSYTLGNMLSEKLRIQQLKLFVQGQNLLMRSGYKGLHPETTSSVLPPLKVITGGLTVTL